MKIATILVIWCALIQAAVAFDIQQDYDEQTERTSEDINRDRRDVIEEEKFHNFRSDSRKDNINQHAPWMPGPLQSEDPTTKISITNEAQEVPSMYQTTESVTDKPTGRGARASNENWIKLPFPSQDNAHRDNVHRDNSLRDNALRDNALRDNVLTPPQPSGELINSRMPRVNFVTQNKGLEASESRNDKESIQRPTRTDDLRTEFVRPEEDRKQYKPVYPRQAVYYPEDNRRPYYDDRYYAADDLYRRDPYYDIYDRKKYYPAYGPRVDRYDEAYDNYVPRKPKRIIYYAHLPEVVRTPPSVDLRYRYSVDPYRRFDDDYNARAGRYDYRFRNRYPYAPLRKDERRFGYRDLAGASTVNKDKKIDEKVTPTPVLPQKEDKKVSPSNNRNGNRMINSHQYHDAGDSSYNFSHKAFNDPNNSDDSYLRFDDTLFHGTVEDPYHRKY